MSGRARLFARLARGLLAAPVSTLWPRSSRRWAFGHAGDLFAGNPKYLFLWMRLHRPDIDATWITGSADTERTLRAAGHPVARRGTPAGVRAALGAGVFAFSHDPADVDLALSRGARHLNLWHGVGLKSLGVGRRPPGIAAWLASFVHAPHDVVASTSDMMRDHFAGQFGLGRERCPQIGYPRLDVAADPLLADEAERIDALDGFRLDPGGYDRVYLYMPTFRDTGRPFLSEALPDLPALAAALAARNALLWIKPHPRTGDAFPDDYPAIRRWPDAIDPQTYLGRLTGLITDYSSVLYDFLAIRDAGAILYTFDLDRYLATDRTLMYPFEENVAGLRVDTFAALCNAIATDAALRPVDGVQAIRARFWGGSPVPASPAVVAYVEGLSASR